MKFIIKSAIAFFVIMIIIVITVPIMISGSFSAGESEEVYTGDVEIPDIGNENFYLPLETAVYTSAYGSRWDSRINGYRMHYGMDIAYTDGSSVYPIQKGVVVHIGDWVDSRGKTIYIVHNINGSVFTSAYYHSSKILVKEGDTVDPSIAIAIQGNTGIGTGPHVHLEISTVPYISYSIHVASSVDPNKYFNLELRHTYKRNYPNE